MSLIIVKYFCKINGYFDGVYKNYEYEKLNDRFWKFEMDSFCNWV